MQKIALCIFSLFLLSTCEPQEGDESPASSSSSSSAVLTSSSASSSSSSSSISSSSSSTSDPLPLSAMGGALSDWTNAWREFLPEFSVSSMKKVETSAMKPDIIDPLVDHDNILDMEEKLDLPYPVLFPSEDGKTVIYVSPAGFEPDTDVAIIKPYENLWERHLHCGTPCSFDGAIWIDNFHAVVTGFSQYYPSNGEERCTETTLCTVVPTLHVFDLQNETVTEYRGPEVNEATFMEAKLE